MYHVQVNIYPGQTKAEFIHHGGDANAGIVLSFATQARTDGQAIRQVAKAIQASGLPWIDAAGRPWIVDLDVLKPLLPELACTAWLKGKAAIMPEFEMDEESGVGFVSVVRGRVLCEIAPKNLVVVASQPEQVAKQELGRRASGVDQMSLSPDAAIEVFFSYSHADDRYRKRIDKHLSLLRRQGLISNWTDHQITAGKNLDEEIGMALARARIILLLISPDFIDSDYCFCTELTQAIERHKEGTARVIPIIVKPCDWFSAPFGKLKALPQDGKPVTQWSTQDQAYTDIALGMRRVIEELATQPKPSAASQPPEHEQKAYEVHGLVLGASLLMGSRAGTSETTNPTAMTTPTAFISYSWDDELHKTWVKDLAARLTGDGVKVTLDRWALEPGDFLPKFMETSIRDHDRVLIVCTPNYKKKSDGRKGGVGYEGDIMTGKVFAGQDPRKFIPILRSGSWQESSPSWLAGKYGVDLSGDPYLETQYNDLLDTLHGTREKSPTVGTRQYKSSGPVIQGQGTFTPPPPLNSGPIKITGIIANEVGTPRNDGTGGSALYAVPFQLSRRPSTEWTEHFVQTWDSPPSFSAKHRPGIARVEGDRVILDGTTVEEVAEVHRDILKVVLDKVNEDINEFERQQQRAADIETERLNRHKQAVDEAAKNISFD